MNSFVPNTSENLPNHKIKLRANRTWWSPIWSVNCGPSTDVSARFVAEASGTSDRVHSDQSLIKSTAITVGVFVQTLANSSARSI
jgi:hypothetical protein